MDHTIDGDLKKAQLGRRKRALARESHTEDVDLKPTHTSFTRKCSEHFYGTLLEEDENMTLSNFSDSSSYVFSSSPSSDVSFSESSPLPSPPRRPAGSKIGDKKRKTRSGKKTTYKHIPHSLKPPHLVAKRNARERKRVQAVNSAFSKLRKHVPYEPRHKRLSKVKTLRFAIDYIQHLHKMIQTHDEQVSAERKSAGMYSAFLHPFHNPVDKQCSVSHTFPIQKSARRRAKLRENASTDITFSSDFQTMTSQPNTMENISYQTQSCSSLAIAPMTPLQKYDTFQQQRGPLSYSQNRESFPRHLTQMSCSSFPVTSSTSFTSNSTVRSCSPEATTDHNFYNTQQFYIPHHAFHCNGENKQLDYQQTTVTDVYSQKHCSYETTPVASTHTSVSDNLMYSSNPHCRPQRPALPNSLEPATHQVTFQNSGPNSGFSKPHYDVFSTNIIDKQLTNVNFQLPKSDIHSSYGIDSFEISKTTSFDDQTVCP